MAGGATGGKGYAISSQAFEVPFFDTAAASLSVGERVFALLPQFPVTATGQSRITAPLAPRWGEEDDRSLKGRIAVLPLLFARHSALGPARDILVRVKAAGAVGAVLVTQRPTWEAIADLCRDDLGARRSGGARARCGGAFGAGRQHDGCIPLGQWVRRLFSGPVFLLTARRGKLTHFEGVDLVPFVEGQAKGVPHDALM